MSAVRPVFYVSDGTGITAETIGHSLLTQFADTRFSTYRVQLPGGAVARCDPIDAPPECKDAQLTE